MGDDGHTLSLFPGTSMMHEEKYWVRSLWLPQQNIFRITLTKAIVNLSAKIVFLASGAGKAEALHEVLYGAYDPDRFPSQVIRPNRGELFWFVDQAAAAKLKK
jgi:6-phosphogluconolactonase